MEQILPLLLWGGFFFVMMRFGCGAHMFGHRHGHQNQQDAQSHQNQAGAQHGQGHGHSVPAPHQAQVDGIKSRTEIPQRYRDPVCGNEVSADKAKTSFHAGEVYYFCSRECREVFEAAPDTYLSGREIPPAFPPVRSLEYVPQQEGGRGHAE